VKIEYVSYLPGGFYQKDEATPGYHTRSVKAAHYALRMEPKDSGSFLALWACVCCRFDELHKAESLVGEYSMDDVLDLGPEGSFPVKYASPLRMLAWWRPKLPFFLDWELYGINNAVSVYMNVPHGNALVESLHWFVASAKCQPGGLSYELAGFDKTHPEDAGSESESGKWADLNMKAIESRGYLKGGRLKIGSVLQALNLVSVPQVVNPEPKIGADGFLEQHRALMRKFRQLLAPYAGQIPALVSRFVETTDTQLGVSMADMFGVLMRSSFPDVFTAERDLESLRAEQARVAREKAKKGK